MFGSFKYAPKLFDKITHRNSSASNCLFSLYYPSTFTKHSNLEDPSAFPLLNHDVISWTSKISSLVRQNQPDKAIGLFKSMLLSDQRPNFITLVSVIRAFGALNCQDYIQVAHGFVIKLGFEQKVPVLTALFGFYSMFDIETAWFLFDQIVEKDVVLWSAMVSACVKTGKYREAVDFFRKMQYDGVEANDVSVVSVLPACAHLGWLHFGKEIHGFLVNKNFYSFTNVTNALVHMYAQCGDLESSVRVFSGIIKKDLISWRTMIHSCIKNDCPRKAMEIFLNMQYSCFEPDEVIVQDTIVASLQAGEFKFGVGFHSYVVKNGFSTFVSVGTALLQMYGKFGEFGSAQSVFDHLDHKDLVTWSAMIAVFSQGGKPYNAFIAFEHMQSINMKPNEITLVSLLQACSATDALEFGESIHGYVIKVGYTSNAYLQSALIDLYCRLGRIQQGRAVFNEIPIKDLICWSTIIKGYGSNGCGLEALETFSDMLECGIKPNDIVFLSVLSACCQCGLEYEGWNWFYSMEEKYGITPKVAHYACMVDLLCHGGNIEEAVDFVKKMPVKLDIRMLGALFAGFRSRTDGPVDMAEFVVNWLSASDPKNNSYYVTLLDMYANSGRWEDVERLRKLADEKGLIMNITDR